MMEIFVPFWTLTEEAGPPTEAILVGSMKTDRWPVVPTQSTKVQTIMLQFWTLNVNSAQGVLLKPKREVW